MKHGWYGGVPAFVAAMINGAILAVAPMAAQAQDAAAEQVSAAEATVTRWFVELKSPPAADGTSLTTLRNEKAAFRRDAAQAGVQFKERFAFDTLWNGLSIEVAPHQVSKLWRIEGVKNIYPVETMRLPETTPGESAELATALAMTGADVAQEELGLNGQGVKVAVMDTGIDYHHPDLGGCFGPGCRVAVGWDFVGDAFNADPASPGYNITATPDADPDDCQGHGTHVAGIIGASGAASGSARGVAPGVTFGAYRVFGCDGSTTADIMVAAMERALADGMNILNMSIGSSFQWPQYPTAQAATRLVNKGISVVASIGNSGTSGLYAASAPGVGAKVIGVASYDNSHVRLRTFTITPDGAAIGYSPATGSPAPPTSGLRAMARTGTATSAADACSALAPGSLSGKAVLIRRGTCTFYAKANNARNAGAAAVVLYNSAPGRFSATVAGSPAITIPVVSISAAEGVLIDNRLATQPSVSMEWTNAEGTFANATGNAISSFSSYGLSPDLELKPDIGAPGGLIRSTYPLQRGGYATLSGTSMASPHTAGAVALLLEARPNTPSNAVRGILQNSADPKNWQGNPGLGFLDQVHRQGAGMLDIPGAILATANVAPAKLSLGESEAGPATRTLTVTNKGSAPVTYAVSDSPALSTNSNTFSPGATTAFASVAFSAPVVVVPAGGSASVDVTITATATAATNRSIYGGYIVFTPDGGGDVLRVPYAGIRGDYQSFQVLTPTANRFPWLAKLVGASYVRQNAGATFTMQGTDTPFVLAHFDHQSQRVRMEVIEAATGKSWHRAFDLQHFGRSSTAAGFFAIDWDGVTVAGNKTYLVPNGSYVLRLSVLKALGDAANPAHWETWDSPAFTVARP